MSTDRRVSEGDLRISTMDRVTAKILAEWKCCEGAFGEDPVSPLLSSSPESSSSSSSSSPSSAGDSMCSSPEMCYSSGHHQDFSAGFTERSAADRGAQQRHGKGKMSTKRRMKASEREKMRMRSLAEALHQLRDYLPPDYSKRGQPLTKIQTLKYTIEYINSLSDILTRA